MPSNLRQLDSGGRRTLNSAGKAILSAAGDPCCCGVESCGGVVSDSNEVYPDGSVTNQFIWGNAITYPGTITGAIYIIDPTGPPQDINPGDVRTFPSTVTIAGVNVDGDYCCNNGAFSDVFHMLGSSSFINQDRPLIRAIGGCCWFADMGLDTYWNVDRKNANCPGGDISTQASGGFNLLMKIGMPDTDPDSPSVGRGNIYLTIYSSEFVVFSGVASFAGNGDLVGLSFTSVLPLPATPYCLSAGHTVRLVQVGGDDGPFECRVIFGEVKVIAHDYDAIDVGLAA